MVGDQLDPSLHAPHTQHLRHRSPRRRQQEVGDGHRFIPFGRYASQATNQRVDVVSVRTLASACKGPTGCCQGGDTSVTGAEQQMFDDYIDDKRGMRTYCLKEQVWVSSNARHKNGMNKKKLEKSKQTSKKESAMPEKERGHRMPTLPNIYYA